MGSIPQIREFVKRMGEYWRQHPPLGQVSLPEARQIAEKVRGHWSKGGPKMARTTDVQVPIGNGTVRIRALDPGGEAIKPALIYLHGGGWTIFSIDTHDRIMREYASRAGIVVVAVDYSLSPEAKFPRAIEETVAVVHWLRKNGATLGVDATRLAIGGDSAGAAMTLASCMMLRDAGEPDAISAMLLNYGAFDSACTAESYQRYGNGGYMWDPGEMLAFWRNYMRDEKDCAEPFMRAGARRPEGPSARIQRSSRVRRDVCGSHGHGRAAAARRCEGTDGGVSGRDAQLPRSGLDCAHQPTAPSPSPRAGCRTC